MTRRYTGGFLSATEQATDSNSANGIYTLQEAGTATALGNFPVGRWTPSRSLKFSSSRSQYIQRQPTNASNQTKGTWSFWVKRGKLGSGQCLYATKIGSVGNNAVVFQFNSSDQLQIIQADTSNNNYSSTSNALFKDVTSWYHIVVSIDTTQAVSSNRLVVWVNGTPITWSSQSIPAQNTTIRMGDSSYPQSIGVDPRDGTYFDGYISEFYYLDGSVSNPTYFGTTDPETGTWVPKQFGYPSYTKYAATAGMITNSGFGGFGAANLVDGDNSSGTAFYADSSAAGSYIQWDLGSGVTKEFRKMSLAVYKSSGSGLHLVCVVQYSDNGSSWTTASSTLDCYTEGANYASGEIFQIGVKWDSVGAHRYWRIYKTDVAAGGDYCNSIDFYELLSDNSPVAYGENGFYLNFSDNSSTSINWAAGADRSGNENNFRTVSHTYGTDIMVDVPGISSVSTQKDIGGVQRGNYATLNPLINTGITGKLSNGNLTYYDNSGTTSIWSTTPATMSIPEKSGKWYFEFTLPSPFSVGSVGNAVGFYPASNSANTGLPASWYFYWNVDSWQISPLSGSGTDVTSQLGGTAPSAGNIGMIAYDSDTGKMSVGKNGVWATSVLFGISGEVIPFYSGYRNNTYVGVTMNFGQSAFAYTPPAGYKALCASNLPNPVIKRSNDHFDTKLWTGNGSAISIGNTQKQNSAYPIERSLKMNGAYSSYFTRTPSVAGNRRTWTYSLWVKRSVLGTRQSVISAGTTNSTGQPGGGLYFTSSTNKLEYIMGGGTSMLVTTSQAFTDTTSWMHLVIAMDTTQASSTQRFKLFVNGVQTNRFDNATYPNQNFDTDINNTIIHAIGSRTDDGPIPNTLANFHIAEVNFIDGAAKTASDFGQFDANNNWVPQRYTGTYGTNGFYLPMKHTAATGFNTVTFTPRSGYNKVTSVGFNPDLIWVKRRNSAQDNFIVDSVRGGTKLLRTNTTGAETTISSPNWITSFDEDGFGSHTDSLVTSDSQYVAWCWDAGTSTVSNTSGTITSSVRANPTNGFSIVTWTGTATGGATVGHGLSAAPTFIISKRRDAIDDWSCYHTSLGGTKYIDLNVTTAAATASVVWNNTNPSSSLFTIGTSNRLNANGGTYVAYCFTDVAGFSKFGTYNGTGATGNSVNLGFKPSLVMIKRTDSAGEWYMWDSTRGNTAYYTKASSSDYESDIGYYIDFTATGFTVFGSAYANNLAGATYIYAAWADNRANTFWKDNSSNNLNWLQSQGAQTNDIVFDSPTDTTDSSGNIIGNYSVIDSNNNNGLTIGSNGLSWVGVGATPRMAYGNLPISSGKWYWEYTISASSSGGNWAAGFGQADVLPSAGTSLSNAVNGWVIMTGSNAGNISKVNNGSFTTLYTGAVTNNVIGVAVDFDAGKAWFSRNGSWIEGDPTAGTTPSFANINAYGPIKPYVYAYNPSDSGTANFGNSAFIYTPPTGFKALNTKNLRDTGSYNLPDSFGNFVNTPDLVWIKQRSGTNYHNLYDTVRGPRNAIQSNTVTGFQTFDSLQTFKPNGFDLSTYVDVNQANSPFVGWTWNRGKVPGFEIVNYGGTGITQAINHNLGQTPKVVMVKKLSSATNSNWMVYHASLGPTYAINLNGAGAAGTTYWNSTPPTSSTFTVDTNANYNAASDSYVAYLWAEVPGFSKFGTYTGNGSSAGPFVYTGFRPAFVLMKASLAAEEWVICDTKRDPYNGSTSTRIYPHLSDAENVSAACVHMFANGFMPNRSGDGTCNVTGRSYIYMAFAEAPFKYANAR
jgi:hypothetical protein